MRVLFPTSRIGSEKFPQSACVVIIALLSVAAWWGLVELALVVWRYL